jgi:hypothetical protein
MSSMIPLTMLSLDTDETEAIFSEVESTTAQRKYANAHHFQK